MGIIKYGTKMLGGRHPSQARSVEQGLGPVQCISHQEVILSPTFIWFIWPEVEQKQQEELLNNPPEFLAGPLKHS